MLLLIFSIALLSGYFLADLDEIVKPLLLSQLIVFSTLFAPLFIPTRSISLSTFGSSPLVSVISFAFLSFLLCLAGSLPGSFLGATFGKTPIPRLLLSDYQIGLRAILLLAIAGSTAIVGAGYIAGVNQQLGAEVTALQSIIGLQQRILLSADTISWNAGTDTILIGLGTTTAQIFHGPDTCVYLGPLRQLYPST